MALPRGRPESLRRAPAPVGVGELGGQLSELVLGLRHPTFLGIHVGQPEQRLGHHQGARVLLQQGFEPLARSRRVMGEYSSKGGEWILGLLVAAVLIGLNGLLLYQTFGGSF